jgi:hypothetical protein
MTAPIDGKALAGVDPCTVEETEHSFLRDVRSETGPRFVDQSNLIRLMGRTGCIVIGDSPFSNPARFAAGTALRSAFRQDVFLQSFPASRRGIRLSRVVRRGFV